MTTESLTTLLRALAAQAWLLPALREAGYRARLATNAAFRREDAKRRERFEAFRDRYGRALAPRLLGGNGASRRALVVGMGFDEGLKAELGLIKGLELAGYDPIVLTWRDPWLPRYYALAGIRSLLFWDDAMPAIGRAQAEHVLADVRAFEDLLRLTYAGSRVGRFTASTAFRQLRVGSLDLSSPAQHAQLIPFLQRAMAAAIASQRLVDRARPDLALFIDKGYTPQGELYDRCIDAGIPAVTWNTGHKSNTLMLKRYTAANRDDHPSSLSEPSWRAAQELPWTPARRRRIEQELFGSYASGDWYSEVGTQFRARQADPVEIRRRLGLDPSKKTAVIFPHILWDGTFFWGTDVYPNYEAWFIETARLACANPHAQWLIKVHPANTVKNARDGVRGEPTELAVLRRAIGELPPHVTVIPAESDISTLSLLQLVDACVTVRGTVGIEAATFGVPAITAGTGRYDRKGFTIDAGTREEYARLLGSIHELPRLTDSQRELAQRFAYGVFVLRPLALTSVTLEYRKDATASLETRICASTADEWRAAPDLRAFAAWINRPDDADFLNSDPVTAEPEPAEV